MKARVGWHVSNTWYGEGDHSQKHKRSQSYSAFGSCLCVVRTEGVIDVRYLSEVAWRFGPNNQTTSNL